MPSFALASILAVPLAAAPRSSLVVNGTDAATCQWPSVVALLADGGAQFCTGALIAPRLVLTAAHCIDPGIAPPAAFASFGEDIAAPFIEVPISGCTAHPDFAVLWDEQGLGTDLAADIGFCELAEDAPPIAIVPVAAGCELDPLLVGADIVVAGFGLSMGGLDENLQKYGEGNGTKRFTAQVLDILADDQLALAGDMGNGVCFGDSGGPAFMQLPDGTWRIVGVASSLHPEHPTECGPGSAHERVGPHLAWLEQTSGVDLTPCFDGDGIWAPGPGCGGFPLDPLGTGEWAAQCPAPVSGDGAWCAPVDPGTTGSDDTGADPTTGATSSSGTSTSPTTGNTGEPTTTTTAGPAGEPSGAVTEEGCGCHTSAPGSPALLALLLLALHRRRPRP